MINYCYSFQEQLVFLRQCHEESIGNDFLWDNLQFSRYNFCILIKSVAVDLHLSKTQELLERVRRVGYFLLKFIINDCYRDYAKKYLNCCQSGVKAKTC